MGKTSFKTHDPFIILEHLDGKIPVHSASFLICGYILWTQKKDEKASTEFDDIHLIRNLMFVNLFCIFSQKFSRSLQMREARVIELTQEIKDKKVIDDIAKKITGQSQESQALVKKVINTEIDPNLNDDDDMYGKNRAVGKVDLGKQMVRQQFRLLSRWIMVIIATATNQANDIIEGLKELILDILSNFFPKKENKEKPYENLSNFHFIIRSMLALISTILYQYTIFRMIVILMYRTDNFVTDTEESGATKPALYVLQTQPIVLDTDTEGGITDVSQNAGYVIHQEAALATILVIDYCMQIIAIMYMMIANLNIDMGKETITDMMNEARFKYKFLTFMITASLTNLGVFMFIDRGDQNYQFFINKVTATIDGFILCLYVGFLIFVQVDNLSLPQPKSTDYYLDKIKGGKILFLILQATKFTLVIFGNMWWMTYFCYVPIPKECICSAIFMGFQFIQYSLFIPSIFELYNLSKIEQKTKAISYREKKSKFYDFVDKISETQSETIKNFLGKQVKKGKEKSNIASNMRILANQSFQHNDSFLQAQQDDLDKAEQDKYQDKVTRQPSLHQFYKKQSEFPKLTNYLNSMMRQKFYLEELGWVQETELTGNAKKDNEGEENDGKLQKDKNFSQIKKDSKTFVTVLMYGLEFDEDDGYHKKDHQMQSQLILMSDKFKNEILFNEQVKKIWRTLKRNDYRPAVCLTKDFCDKSDKEKNPEELNWDELQKFTCYRSCVPNPPQKEDANNQEQSSLVNNDSDDSNDSEKQMIIDRLKGIRELYQFDIDDYENELRFHLQYCMFSDRIASSKKFMTYVFENIIERFLNQSGNLRKLYGMFVLGEDVDETNFDENINGKIAKFQKYFYKTKTKELSMNIFQDVTDLYEKVAVEYKEMGRIIQEILDILNPELKNAVETNLHTGEGQAEAKRPKRVEDTEDEDEQMEIAKNLEHKKKLLQILRNGIDFFGLTISIPGLSVSGKKENRMRNQIQKLCRDFEKSIDNLLKIKSMEQGTSVGQEFTLQFPLKLEKRVEFRLFKMIQAKYQLKQQEYKTKEDKEKKSDKDQTQGVAKYGIMFQERDLIKSMIRIDYQRDISELSLVDVKREDLLFDFVDSKFQYLHKKLLSSFSFAADLFQYRKELDAKKEDLAVGSCINMHGLRFVELDPKTGAITKIRSLETDEKEQEELINGLAKDEFEKAKYEEKTFNGWKCVDCNEARRQLNDVVPCRDFTDPISLLRDYTYDAKDRIEQGRTVKCIRNHHNQLQLEFEHYDGNSVNNKLILPLTTQTAWKIDPNPKVKVEFMNLGQLWFTLKCIEQKKGQIQNQSDQISLDKDLIEKYAQYQNANDQQQSKLDEQEEQKEQEQLFDYFIKNENSEKQQIDVEETLICQIERKNTTCSVRKWYKKQVEYEFDEQPFCFAFVCESEQCKCSQNRRTFYCGICGAKRLSNYKQQKFLEVSDDIYTFSFLSMLTDATPDNQASKDVSPSISTLPEQSSLYFKAQMIFFIQTTIIGLLIYKNIFSKEKAEFKQAYPTLLFMQLLSAYLFHIQTLGDAKNSYARILFIVRYPERFNKSLRSPAFFLCMQQFFVNMLCEIMNLATLAQQPSFQELIMNYVAFAGILEIDNVFMSTQMKFFKDLAKIQEEGNQRYLEQFKDPKFHHYHKATFLQRTIEHSLRFVYKVIYFYLFPVFVVPVGLYAWRSTQDEFQTNDYKKVDWGPLNEQFGSTVYIQIYSFIIIIIFTFVMYVMLYVYSQNKDLNENKEKVVTIMNKHGRPIIGALLLLPFLMYGVSTSVVYFNTNLKDGLEETGNYIFWFDINQWFTTSYHKRDALYLEEVDDHLEHNWMVSQTNLYLIISIILNWKLTPDIDGFLDILHFVLNCFMYPVIFYVFQILCFDLTVKPIQDVLQGDEEHFSWQDIDYSLWSKQWSAFTLAQPEERYILFILQIYTFIYTVILYNLALSKDPKEKGKFRYKLCKTRSQNSVTDDKEPETLQNSNSYAKKLMFVLIVVFFAMLSAVASILLLNYYDYSVFPIMKFVCQKLAYAMRQVFVEPFERYKFGESNSFLAYWLVYFALTILGALMLLLMCKVFPENESKIIFIKNKILMKKGQYKPLLIVMFMIPFQIYFVWNVGFFYILGACTLSENAKRAIQTGTALKLIKNPALFTISVISAPHLFLRNLLEFFMKLLGIQNFGDLSDMLQEFVLAGPGSFEKSFSIFILGYIIVISPMVYFFLLSKGDTIKRLETKIKQLFKQMGAGGQSLMKGLFMVTILFVIIPLVTYALLNVGLFQSVSWITVKAIKFKNDNPQGPIVIGGIVAFIGFMLICYGQGLFNEEEEEEKDDDEPEQIKAQLKTGIDNMLSVELRKLDAQTDTLCDEDDFDDKKGDKKAEEGGFDANTSTIFGFFILFLGVSIFPQIAIKITNPFDFYAKSFLTMIAVLNYNNSQLDEDQSSSQKMIQWFRILIACAGLVFIMARPLSEGFKCYTNVIGCGGEFDNQFEFLTGICAQSDVIQACT